jgi:hypothetical protein
LQDTYYLKVRDRATPSRSFRSCGPRDKQQDHPVRRPALGGRPKPWRLLKLKILVGNNCQP